MKNRPKATALLCSVILAGAGGAMSSAVAGSPVTVPGWPAYLAMGGIGGPDVSPLTASTTGGNDDFQNRPVDVIFKYAGQYGDGDPGIIDPPMEALQMTGDLTTLSGINNHATRVAIVEYLSNMSGNKQVDDFSNSSTASGDGYANYTYDQKTFLAGVYIMPKHFITLGLDAKALDDEPVAYNGSNYYGTLILNPDMLGTVEQQGYSSNVDAALSASPVNTAVDQALCFLTTSHAYQNESAPNGAGPVYVGKTYTGTPLQILEAMLNDGYPTWSINGYSDSFWPTTANNMIYTLSGGYPVPTSNESVVATWFDSCISNPTYNTTTYQRPNFANTVEGWAQANNWMIRTFSPKGHVTFGWQENMWPTLSGFWLEGNLTDSQIASIYSGPVTTFLQNYAPSAITTGALGAAYAPDYFVFDRYEYDDSVAPGAGTFYNAQSWDNYLVGIGQVSTNFNSIPVMMWQIPGGHIPNTTETQPEYFNPLATSQGYVFSTAPVYFFGDSNLTANLSNIIFGPASQSDTNTSVGDFQMAAGGFCSSSEYNCVNGVSTYKDYLLSYEGKLNNFNWSQDNGKLAKAAANNVFAILWGGGNTTNVIKNWSNPNDNGWLAGKIIAYYQNPTALTPDIAHTHDLNGDSNVSDILWRDSSGNLAVWMMSGGQLSSGVNISQVSTVWTVAATRDFNRDGSSDILWLDNAGNLALWLMNGGSLSSGITLGNVGTQWTIAGTGDFNGDRNGDILWRNSQTGDLSIWLMDGGQLSSGIDLGVVSLAWSVAGTGDFNGDGTSDILWRNSQTGDLAIWFMKNGQLSSGADLGAIASIWSVVGTGDFNGDGTSDILWRDSSGNLAIWLISNGQMVSGATLGQVPTTWSVSETGDFDGDGKSDILWLDNAGDLAVWLMNGTSLSSGINLGNVGTSWQPQGKNAD